MKETSLIRLASDWNMTLSRATHEVLAATGWESRIYPIRIRRSMVSEILEKRAIAYRVRQLRRMNSTPLAGPKGVLP